MKRILLLLVIITLFTSVYCQTNIRDEKGGVTPINVKGTYVGIGTTSPASLLDIKGTPWCGIKIQDVTKTNGRGIKNQYLDGNNDGWAMYFGGHYVGQPLGFAPISNGVQGTTALTLFENGYVGLGTTQPIAKLDITNNANKDIGLSVVKSFSGGGEGIPVAKFNFVDAGVENSGIDFGTKTAGGRFDLIKAYYKSKLCFRVQQNGATTIKGMLSCEEIEVKDIAATNLRLEGDLATNSIIVKANGNTADFVFEEDYNLKDLSEVETYIKEHKHLPEIPSASEMEASGVNLAELNKLLLQKVEELTLYAIQQEEARRKEQGEREVLEEQVKAQEARLAKLEALLFGK